MEMRGAEILLYGLIILLPLSSLIARRPKPGALARMALAWLGIFAIGLLIASQRTWIAEAAHNLFGEQQVAGGETRIRMADDGHFYGDVMVNGTSRRMLIDSGATTTALSIETAKAAGIDVDESPFATVIETANGPVTAQVATAKSIVIGSVTATDLGVVVSPAFGSTDVIGMNLLSRLKSWHVEDQVLVLTPK
ncbi:hypothetical protein ASE75_06575 [Sphingomonas sp. Leaf17]|uniref:retropepsin-like aspartic protease family protein n=1 Tax=Sphingomonas sp. Leaf17 TaxID=1735683 RepID=UPI000700F33D|nr:retropepsin-like aspartic protease [Sphingomonas sp. Leaf17]KQM65886.1 hypothetical protein ASE75_06575 [Sphingomonas sp. Leaf17]